MHVCGAARALQLQKTADLTDHFRPDSQACREEGKRVSDFPRTDTVIYTNLGLSGLIDRRLEKAGKKPLLEAPPLIGLHHSRGRDELVHRALKDPQAKRMPFQDFFPNMVVYSGGAQGFQSL